MRQQTRLATSQLRRDGDGVPRLKPDLLPSLPRVLDSNSLVQKIKTFIQGLNSPSWMMLTFCNETSAHTQYNIKGHIAQKEHDKIFIFIPDDTFLRSMLTLNFKFHKDSNNKQHTEVRATILSIYNLLK